MSYESTEESEQDSAPVLLYQFIQNGTTYRYVALNEYFTFDGHTWVSAALLPGKIGSSGTVPSANLSLKLPRTLPLASTFENGTPDFVTTVTIFRTHVGLTEKRTVWKGRVTNSIKSRSHISLDCESVFSSMQQPGLLPACQRNCRHVLFDDGCKLNAAWYAASGVLTAINGYTITFHWADGILPIADLTGGTLTASDGTVRTILIHDGFNLTLMRPIRSLSTELGLAPSGVAITLHPGCDFSLERCVELGNIGNYGGFAWFPTRNPVDGNSIA